MSLDLAKPSRARRGKSAGMRLAGLMLLQALFQGACWPQAPAEPRAGGEFEKQEKIYRSEGSNVPSGYVTGRSLTGYAELLPSGFRDALKKLGPADRWLDIGAGAGQAILDYYALGADATQGETRAQSRGKARVVAVSIEDRRSDQLRQLAARLGGGQIRYLYGKRLREYSREELGKFQIITDVYGGFSYTENLARYLESVLGALAIKGDFFTMVQSVHLEDGKDNPRTWYLTELADAAGRDVKVCTWLKSVACVEVACESMSTWETPTELIRVRKVCDNVSVPGTKLLQYEAGNPPGRRFQLVPR